MRSRQRVWGRTRESRNKSWAMLWAQAGKQRGRNFKVAADMKHSVQTEEQVSWRQLATLQYLCLLLLPELIYHSPSYTMLIANLTSTCFLKDLQTHTSRLQTQSERELKPPTLKQWKKPARCHLHPEYKPKPPWAALKAWLSEPRSDAAI